MTKLFFALLIALGFTVTVHAQPQNAAAAQQSATGTGQAIISPNAINVNSYGAPITAASIDSNIHTNQAASAAPAFGVQGTGCVKPGKGASLQVVGAGASVALSGDMDDGCEAPRDINTMNMTGGFTQDDKTRRACAVPALAKAAPQTCQRVLDAAKPGTAVALLP